MVFCQSSSISGVQARAAPVCVCVMVVLFGVDVFGGSALLVRVSDGAGREPLLISGLDKNAGQLRKIRVKLRTSQTQDLQSVHR